MKYLVTDKLFPFDADGGTAFTSYEWANELHDNYRKCTVLYHGKAEIDERQVPFKIIHINTIFLTLYLLKIVKKNDHIFLNSAFKRFELIYALLTLTKRSNLYWLCHGSLDITLCKGVKKAAYVYFWAKLMTKIIRHYICNSYGEHQRLPHFIRPKSIIIENLLPKYTLDREKSITCIDHTLSSHCSEHGYSLIFGRIDKKKKIIETIHQLQAIGYFTRNKLKIVGVQTSASYIKDITRLIAKLGISNNCELDISLTSGSKKIQLIKQASNVLLFSDSEGLPVVILEAVMLGTPVICSSGCNAEHLIPLVNVIELDRLNLTHFETKRLSAGAVDTSSFDTGRIKLAEFFNGYTV